MNTAAVVVAIALAVAVTFAAALAFVQIVISQDGARLPDPIPEAEQRWAASNAAARAAGCPCGEPATKVRYDPRVVGSVPHETWTCAQHVGAAMWRGRRPAWEYSRQLPVECWGWAGPIDGEPNRWHHPIYPTEALARFGVDAVGDDGVSDGSGLAIVELMDPPVRKIEGQR